MFEDTLDNELDGCKEAELDETARLDDMARLEALEIVTGTLDRVLETEGWFTDEDTEIRVALDDDAEAMELDEILTEVEDGARETEDEDEMIVTIALDTQTDVVRPAETTLELEMHAEAVVVTVTGLLVTIDEVVDGRTTLLELEVTGGFGGVRPNNSKIKSRSDITSKRRWLKTRD